MHDRVQTRPYRLSASVGTEMRVRSHPVCALTRCAQRVHRTFRLAVRAILDADCAVPRSPRCGSAWNRTDAATSCRFLGVPRARATDIAPVLLDVHARRERRLEGATGGPVRELGVGAGTRAPCPNSNSSSPLARLERRPGNGGPVQPRLREAAVGNERVDPAAEGPDLLECEQRSKLATELTVQLGSQS